jgi:hypothetical protein
MTENEFDPAVRAGVHRVVASGIPGADAEARILHSVRTKALRPGSQPQPRFFHAGGPLRATAIGILTAAVVAGSVVVGFAIVARRSPSPVHPPPVSARATPTPSAVPSPTSAPATPSATPTSAQWVSRSVPVGSIGAIVLGPSNVYVISNENEPSGEYSSALADIVRINRNSGAVDDGGRFPGAVSLALAGGYLWVATGPSPGVPLTDANVLYRLNALTLAVEQRTSIAELAGTSNNPESPDLTAAGNLLWVGYGPHVARLSGTSGATIWSRNVGGPGAVSSISVDPTGRVIYAGFDANRPSIVELNAITGMTVAESTAYFGYDLGGAKLAAFVGDVWVAYATGMDGTTVQLQASNLASSAGGVDGLHTNGIDVFRGNGILWMSDGGGDLLFCANEVTGAVRATFPWQFGGLIAADSSGTVVGGSDGVSFLKNDPQCYS